jgi:hypothetical protein
MARILRRRRRRSLGSCLRRLDGLGLEDGDEYMVMNISDQSTITRYTLDAIKTVLFVHSDTFWVL